jgi:hypothetical protein
MIGFVASGDDRKSRLMRRVEIVRYVTRLFAHLETLDRTRRWLVQAGVNPSHIEVHTHGVFRITVAVAPGETVEVERVLDAAESSDPAGNPSFWDQTRNQQVDPQHKAPGDTLANPPHTQSYVVGWTPGDADREVM